MIKSKLVRRLGEQNPHLYYADIERSVATIFREIEVALARGDRVELRGFGVFTTRTHSAKLGRNPKNGVSVAVPERRHPFFRMSREMHTALNPSEPASPASTRRRSRQLPSRSA
jgi:integration host factor subunit beta